MTRKTTTTVRSLVVATLLATGALFPEAASAQEAIMLETIGAVRMVQPGDTEASRTQPQPTSTTATDAKPAERHADNR